MQLLCFRIAKEFQAYTVEAAEELSYARLMEFARYFELVEIEMKSINKS